jgi:hypothetical protein
VAAPETVDIVPDCADLPVVEADGVVAAGSAGDGAVVPAVVVVVLVPPVELEQAQTLTNARVRNAMARRRTAPLMVTSSAMLLSDCRAKRPGGQEGFPSRYSR